MPEDPAYPAAAIARAYRGSAVDYADINADRSFAAPLLDALAALLSATPGAPLGYRARAIPRGPGDPAARGGGQA